MLNNALLHTSIHLPLMQHDSTICQQCDLHLYTAAMTTEYYYRQNPKKNIDSTVFENLTQNVAFEFFANLAKIDRFSAFLMNFCPLVNVARFVRNLECDFFCDFQTLCWTW